MEEHDYVTRGKPFEDDSSAALGLDHDPKGRKLVSLPTPTTGYDPDLVGKSPEAMAELLKQREDDRDGNNIDRLMREHPGGRLPGTHSSSGSKKPKKPAPSVDHSGRVVPFSGKDAAIYRPNVISGRVDTRARNALNAQAVSCGEIFNAVGTTLAAGVPWAKVEWMLNELAQGRHIA